MMPSARATYSTCVTSRSIRYTTASARAIDAAVIILFVDGRLPWPALAVIVARDALLLAGTRIVLPRGYDFSVNLLGKTATWVLYTGIGFLVAGRWSPNWPLWLFWIGVGLALGAAVVYVGSARKALRR